MGIMERMLVKAMRRSNEPAIRKAVESLQFSLQERSERRISADEARTVIMEVLDDVMPVVTDPTRKVMLRNLRAVLNDVFADMRKEEGYGP